MPVLTRTGTQAYRVTGTIRGKQRKRQFMILEDAEAQRDAWEVERLSAAAALRPKVTRLTQAQLAEADACFELLKGTGFTLADAVRALLRNPPSAPCELTFEAAYKQFLDAKKGFISDPQHSNYETVCRRLAAHLPPGTKLRDVDTARIHAWLTSLQVSPKSWNNYRGDLTVVFNWFIAAPRKWISENPIVPVPRYRKRDVLPGTPEVLSVKDTGDLMHWLEREKPHWVTTHALGFFAGIRPDREDGEMNKIADAVRRGKGARVFRGNSIFLTKFMTKDGRARRVPLTGNLLEWLQKYPPTEENLRGGTRAEYAAIRAKWKIPHDGLRHTSISACAALHGIAEATVRHGNSEKVCRDNYLDLFSVDDAKAFYEIRPAGSPSPAGDAASPKPA